MSDPTTRFSIRADSYALYRPSYPAGVTHVLARECGLSAASRIADIGSGTGLLAERFLALGCEVVGVEPNAGMRAAGDRMLAGQPRFRSIDGRAEATGLPDASVDFVTAGQAFHWFDPGRARVEFERILRPGGWLVLVWNERVPQADRFQSDYDALIKRYAPESGRIQGDKIDIVFGRAAWKLQVFPNAQRLGREGLEGRLTSSSYAPQPGTPEHLAMADALTELFARHRQDGAVTLRYETQVYYGRIAA